MEAQKAVSIIHAPTTSQWQNLNWIQIEQQAVPFKENTIQLLHGNRHIAIRQKGLNQNTTYLSRERLPFLLFQGTQQSQQKEFWDLKGERTLEKSDEDKYNLVWEKWSYTYWQLGKTGSEEDFKTELKNYSQGL